MTASSLIGVRTKAKSSASTAATDRSRSCVLAHQHGVHRGAQRLQGLAGLAVQRAAAHPAGVDAVRDDHHRAQVAPGVAAAQLGQGLADAGGLALGGRAQGRGVGGGQRLAEAEQVDPVARACASLEQRGGRLDGVGGAQEALLAVGRLHGHRARAVHQHRHVVGHPGHLAQLQHRLQGHQQAGGHREEAQPQQQQRPAPAGAPSTATPRRRRWRSRPPRRSAPAARCGRCDPMAIRQSVNACCLVHRCLRVRRMKSMCACSVL